MAFVFVGPVGSVLTFHDSVVTMTESWFVSPFDAVIVPQDIIRFEIAGQPVDLTKQSHTKITVDGLVADTASRAFNHFVSGLFNPRK